MSFALLFVLALPAAAQDLSIVQSPVIDTPTLTTIGVRIPYQGDANENASVSWNYRPAGDTAWKPAPPMLRVLPATVPSRTLDTHFAGSIFDLQPGTTYDLRVIFEDPDGGGATYEFTAFTRAVPPADPQTPRLVTVHSPSELQAAANSARPGDVIELQPGVYPVQSLFVAAAGTPENPIFFRGANPHTVILDGGGCEECNVIEVYSNYVTIESLTIQNARQGVRFMRAGGEGNVLRRTIIRNVAYGVNGRNDQRGFYFADNVLEGRLQFPLAYDDDGGVNADSYGIALYGSGHDVAHNQFTGFANSISVRQVGARSLDIYGNDIRYAYDDAIELDGSEGNVRAFRNRITNAYTAVSLQPILGGPAYVLRNVAYNLKYEQMKFHGRAVTPAQNPSGVLAYHNTFVSPTRALRMESPLPNHNIVLVNNLFIGPAEPLGGLSGDWNAPLDRVRFDSNGYYPDGKFFFRTPELAATAPTLAAVYSLFELEQQGKLVDANVLEKGVVGPASFQTFRRPLTPVLSRGSLAVDAAIPLPGLNDSYSGAGPDLGALEQDQPIPVYGPRPVENRETNPSPETTH